VPRPRHSNSREAPSRYEERTALRSEPCHQLEDIPWRQVRFRAENTSEMRWQPGYSSEIHLSQRSLDRPAGFEKGAREKKGDFDGIITA
jgi:hypothetical protein